MCSKAKMFLLLSWKNPNAQAGEVYRTLIAAPTHQDWAGSVAHLRLQTGQGTFWRFWHCVGAVEAEVGLENLQEFTPH